MKDHSCCYHQCPEEGTVHIGPNGRRQPLDLLSSPPQWHAARARFLADDGGCEMEELGELLWDKCWDDAITDEVLQ